MTTCTISVSKFPKRCGAASSPSTCPSPASRRPGPPRFRTIQVYPKDLPAHARHNTARLSRVGAEKKGDAIMNRQHQIEATVVLFAGILYLTGSFLKAILVSISVLVACIVGFGPGGSFAIAIVAIAVVLGASSPDQWMQLWQEARRAFSTWLCG